MTASTIQFFFVIIHCLADEERVAVLETIDNSFANSDGLPTSNDALADSGSVSNEISIDADTSVNVNLGVKSNHHSTKPVVITNTLKSPCPASDAHKRQAIRFLRP